MACPSVDETSTLVFYVNGQKICEEYPDPDETLLKYLRRKLLLPGTKLACGQGACGACTVMVSHYDRNNKKICNRSMTACLVPVCSLHGQAITTVEGVGSVNTKLHPIQEQLVAAHGSQCGYCTPGFVMSMYTLLRNDPTPSMKQVHKAIRGNLCRCTGYRPILDGFKPFTKDYCPMGDQCCKRTSDPDSGKPEKVEATVKLYDPSQEPIFPPELQLSDALDQQQLMFRSGSVTWYRPRSVRQMLRLKAQYPGAKIVAGNTSLGLEQLHQDKHYSVLLSVSGLADMTQIVTTETGIRFGAAVSLSTVEDFVEQLLAANPKDFKYRSIQALASMLEEFAAMQTKNMVTLGGCIASAWSNSDVIPLFCALRAKLHVQAHNSSEISINLSPEYFKGAGETMTKDSQVILAITVPYCNQEEYVYSMKQSQRDFDTALLSTSSLVSYDTQNVITQLTVYFGNILPVVYFAENLSKGLIGKSCTPDLPSDALVYLQRDFEALVKVNKDIMTPELRSLTEAAVWKLVMQMLVDISGLSSLPKNIQGSVVPLDSGYIQGTQVYDEVPPDQSEHDAVGRPIPHRSSRQQTSGEAQYINDIPYYENELHLGLVTSTHAHARILNIDPSEALKVKGVVDFITHKDIPGKNSYGIIPQDELIFAVDEVCCYGQVIAGVLATSEDVAWKAAKLINITYEPLPHITNIQDAIEAESFYENRDELRIGDIETGFSEAEETIEGEIEIHGQEHFYMETTCALGVPMREEGEIKLYLPVQSPTYIQGVVAKALDIAHNRVDICHRRTGGAFGGKETRLIVALPVAVAAFKIKRPVRCVLDRDTDMQITGGRTPFLAKYKIGVKKSGQLTAVKVVYYGDSGHTTDASPIVLQEAMRKFDSCYRVPNAHLQSITCKTNLPSNTAFRGYGCPQTIYITETFMQHVAEQLKLNPVDVRELNMAKAGDSFPANGISDLFTGDRCWSEVKEKSNYNQRLNEIQEFNSNNKYRKQGIHIGPVKFGMPSPLVSLNQGHALVNIYLDGTVLVHHGGVEMGQGLHTKITQIASRALGNWPIERIHIAELSTKVIPPSVPTISSTGTELFGAAVLNACEKLERRLAPFKEKNKSGKWMDWVTAAYEGMVSLSATGYYKVDEPNFGFDLKTGKGVGFTYYSCGAACSEVEVDILTGQHVVKRVDIVMDVGRSINPAIDIGQIEGAFLQGYGLNCLEELKFAKNGRLKTSNALGYKIPVVTNVPREFNVSLLKGSSNPKAVYSAKGIGEPPLLLAHTVAMAIRAGVAAYRQDIGLPGYFRMDSPTTPDQVRALCPK